MTSTTTATATITTPIDNHNHNINQNNANNTSPRKGRRSRRVENYPLSPTRGKASSRAVRRLSKRSKSVCKPLLFLLLLILILLRTKKEKQQVEYYTTYPTIDGASTYFSKGFTLYLMWHSTPRERERDVGHRKQTPVCQLGPIPQKCTKCIRKK